MSVRAMPVALTNVRRPRAMQIHSLKSSLFACMAVVALAALPTAAAANDEETCVKQPDNLAVAVCSRAIESKQFTGRSLARIHTRRGGAYQALGDTKRALADYNT